MDLRVLGKTSDDKGSQLEQLTKRLLEEMGYIDIVVNSVGTGGHEIDVQADRIFPSLGGEQRIRVICECKAHQNPNSISDWLKFLGKVFVEEARLKKQVNGCFIALSGVNGNVAGNYDSLHQNRENIDLISGDTLTHLLVKIFDVISLPELTKHIVNLTSRQFTSFILCYYHHRVYWLIKFEDDKYTVLSHKGISLVQNQNAEVLSLISNNDESGEYIDLQAEADARKRLRRLEVFTISGLMLLDGNGTIAEIKNALKNEHIDNVGIDLDVDELQDAAQRLENQSLIYSKNEQTTQKLYLSPDQPDKVTEHIIKIYKYIFQDDVVVAVIGSAFYDKYINLGLLNSICDIQSGLKIPEERKEECLKLLRWSPSALAWALHPDPMIVKHRKDGLLDERSERSDINYFLRQLVVMFKRDFDLQALKEYFYAKRRIREIDTKEIVDIKGFKQIELHLEMRSRIAIGELAPEMGGGFIKVLVFEDTPEYWEIFNPDKQKD